jgi:hypothetical protein
MQTTGNLGLKKPEGTDIVDIADLNGNMDILDNAVNGKVDKVTGKQLSTNDYTAAEKTKLAGIATGANNYTHPNHTGDVTSNGDGVTAIAPGVIVDADVNVSAGIAWSKVSKTGASLADLPTRSAGDLSSGTLPAARLPAATGDVTSPAGSNVFTLSAGIQGQINSKAPLVTTPQQTTADITYYVRTDGSDNNTGLANTAGVAFRTIQKAVSMIPQIVNHAVSVNVAAGTYAEEPSLKGFSGSGHVGLYGTGVVNVIAMEIGRCQRVQIFGITFTTTTKTSVNTYEGGYIEFRNCIFTSTGGQRGLSSLNQNVTVDTCTFSNKTDAILLEGGKAYITNCTGVNNNTAILPGSGAIVTVRGTIPAGAISSDWNGIFNPWGDNTQLQRPYFYAGPSSGQTLTSANVWHKLSYDIKNADYLNNYDPSISAFTTPSNGIYCITGSVLFSNSWDSDEIKLSIGSESTPHQSISSILSGGRGYVSTGGSLTVSLPAGEKVSLWAQSSKENIITSPDGNYCYFTITRVA